MTRAQRAGSDAREGGYTLVELMVAMVITLVVSGAIYGLLTSGGNAFRREPEVADRQQNIRIAMDLISRDILTAGSGMPLVGQVFTHTDNPTGGPGVTGSGAPYLNGGGPRGVLGAPGQAQRGAPPTGTQADGSDNSDILEVLIADESCPAFRVCSPALFGTVATVSTRETIPNPNACLLPPGAPGSQGLLLLTDNQVFTVQPATLLALGSVCGGVGTNGQVRLAAALPEWPPARALTAVGGGPPAGIQGLLYAGKVVRYMIALDPSDNTTPSLWRSETGRYDAQGNLFPAPGAGTNWQIVARGIEDLQVEYMNGGGLWSNNPGVVNACAAAGCVLADYNNAIRRVRVTLSARTLAPQLQGQTAPVGGPAPNAVRGQLVSVIAPRAAMIGLQAQAAVTAWP